MRRKIARKQLQSGTLRQSHLYARSKTNNAIAVRSEWSFRVSVAANDRGPVSSTGLRILASASQGACAMVQALRTEH